MHIEFRPVSNMAKQREVVHCREQDIEKEYLSLI